VLEELPSFTVAAASPAKQIGMNCCINIVPPHQKDLPDVLKIPKEVQARLYTVMEGHEPKSCMLHDLLLEQKL
jgi:hypothetical protein